MPTKEPANATNHPNDHPTKNDKPKRALNQRGEIEQNTPPTE